MPYTSPTVDDLLEGISETDSQRVARLCTERRFRPQAVIFSKGDPGDNLYIIREGKVWILSISDKGTETIVHILSKGAVFGELLLSEEKREFTAVAGTEVRVSALSKRGLLEALDTIPGISRNFIRILSRRLAKVEKEYGEFGHTWSYDRLRKVLLRLCEEHGTETPQGTVIQLRLTHEDIANLIGTTRETVTNQLNRFRRLKLVSRQGRNLVVHRSRLEEYSR